MYSNRISAHASLTDLRIIQIIIRAYLVGFIMVGCIPRPEPVPVDQARATETRTIYATQAQVMKASFTTLREMHYSIEVDESGFGHIIASTQNDNTGGADADEGMSERNVLIITAILAVIIGIATLFSIGETTSVEDYEDDEGPVSLAWLLGKEDEDDSPKMFDYRLIIDVTIIDSLQVQVSVSSSSKSTERKIAREAGAVEDPMFFDRFFRLLVESLN